MSRVLTTSNGMPVSDSNPLPVRMEGGGAAGESAYEIAVRHGFEGTEEEWLESLKGEKGDAFTYDDFTPEQLESLRGPEGQPGDDAEPQFTQEQVNALLALIDDGGDA